VTSLLLHRAWKSVQQLSWKPLVFPKDGIVSIPASEKVDEDTVPGYVTMCYYLVRIGHIFQNRYQVVGKLGFGISSTLWLARDPEYDQILWEVG
jgi:serine/threonine-protein kinase SRPK3